MIIQVCDRCGKKSPDENGKVKSLYWSNITINKTNKEGMPEKYLLCEECTMFTRSIMAEFIRKGVYR